MGEFFASWLGRLLTALMLTVIVVISLRQGTISGRYGKVRQEDSPTGFGCMMFLWIVLAVGFWLSLLF